MSNLKAISSMNEALGKINEFDSSLNLNTSRDRFEDANEAIKDRYRKENVYSELSENYSEKLAQEIDFLSLDDEINRRLAEFNQQS
jgi:phage shock protein A